jgi:hypothetical protein
MLGKSATNERGKVGLASTFRMTGVAPRQYFLGT